MIQIQGTYISNFPTFTKAEKKDLDLLIRNIKGIMDGNLDILKTKDYLTALGLKKQEKDDK